VLISKQDRYSFQTSDSIIHRSQRLTPQLLQPFLVGYHMAVLRGQKQSLDSKKDKDTPKVIFYVFFRFYSYNINLALICFQFLQIKTLRSGELN